MMIEHWAHMLDEAFGSEAYAQKLPKNENEKFVLNDVMPNDEFDNASDDEISELFTKIWPKYC